MKKSVILLLTVMLCLVLSSCEGNISEDSANTLVFEAPVKSSRISEFMERNPYFNPYNTLTDCDGEYIYYVQQELTRGIYRLNSDGSYPDDDYCFSVQDEDRSAEYDAAFTLAANGEYIYFTQDNQLCRRSADGSDFKSFSEPYIMGRDYYLNSIKFINDNLITGWTNDCYIVSTCTEDDILGNNEGEVFTQKGISEDEFACFVLRRPWCELLPEHWQFRRYRPGEHSACIVTGNEDDLPVKEYKWNGTDSFVLVDYSAQFIYRIERTNDYSEPRGDYTVQLIDLNGEEYASVSFSVPVFDNILWSNTCDGKIYGCTERGQMVVYSIPDDELILSEKREVNGSIDVTNGLVFYRSDYGVVNIWNPNDRATEE